MSHSSWIGDSTLYAVLLSSDDYVPWKTISCQFISPFEGGNIDKCVYIVKASGVLDPFFVFEDYGPE